MLSGCIVFVTGSLFEFALLLGLRFHCASNQVESAGKRVRPSNGGKVVRKTYYGVRMIDFATRQLSLE